MPLHFLNLKSFHPANKANQRRLWIAEEEYKENKRRELEALREHEREQELYQNNQLAKLEEKKNQQNVDKMRQRKEKLAQEQMAISGSFASASTDNGDLGEASASASGGKKKRKRKRGNGGGSNTANAPQANPNSLSAILATVDEVPRGVAELPNIPLAVASHKMNFMYIPPPGLKAALEREKKLEEEKKQLEEHLAALHGGKPASSSEATNEPEGTTSYDEMPPLLDQETMEPVTATGASSSSSSSSANAGKGAVDKTKYVPKDKVSVHEKFPFLKHAPVEGKYTDNVKITHKPFGIELRDVKCMRCGQYGHTSGDRECPLKDFNPLDARRQLQEDPMALILEREEAIRAKGDIKPFNFATMNKEDSATASLLSDLLSGSNEDDADILASLSKSERKLLMKKYKKLQRKMEKLVAKEKEGDEVDDREKRKKEKRKKRSRSRSPSDDESDGERSRKRKRGRSRSRSRSRSPVSSRSRRRSRSRSRSPERSKRSRRSRSRSPEHSSRRSRRER